MSEELANATPKSQDFDKITFCQHSIPSLRGGKHTIQVKQTIDSRDKSSFLVAAHKDERRTYEAERTFYVNADRFLLPAGVVKSVFPPRGAGGTFGLALPHVVLADKILPWAWTLDPDPETVRSRDTTPWLALLVFTLEDGSIPEIVQRPLGDLDKEESGILCYPGLTFSADVEDPEATINTIDVPVDLFGEVVPTAAELTYLAHTRIVGVNSRRMKSSDKENAPEEYAVVVANRLPRSEKTVVHLVALVGMRDYIPGSGAPLPSGTEFVRLVSLDSWQFLTTEPIEDFKYLLLQTLKEGDPFTLRIPAQPLDNPSEEDVFVQNAFAMGYAALNHQTRLSDKTVSWYRGPLVPYEVEVDAVTLPAFNSDSLTRYDNQTGLFDTSYAAAWQLGRLLALEDKVFSVSLYNWKMNSQIEDIREIEQEIIQSSMGRGLAARLQSRRTLGKRTASSFTDSLLELLADELPVSLEHAAKGTQASAGAVAPSKLPKIEFATLESRVTTQRASRTRNVERIPLPELVKEWLGNLRLLRGVPFSYLVPDERMLPPESLRFVTMDRNWLNSLTDGALSIGRSTEGMLSQDNANFEYFRQEALAASTGLRSLRLNIPRIRSPQPAGDISGFLLHSRLVRDYPGIEAQGFASADKDNLNANPLEIYHFERIAENVLLCLFVGMVKQIRIMLPSEGVNFGVDQFGDEFRKEPLRSVDPDNPGDPLTGKGVVIPFRDDSKRIVDVQALIDALKAQVSPSGEFTSAELSLQMADEGPVVIFWTAPQVEDDKEESVR